VGDTDYAKPIVTLSVDKNTKCQTEVFEAVWGASCRVVCALVDGQLISEELEFEKSWHSRQPSRHR